MRQLRDPASLLFPVLGLVVCLAAACDPPPAEEPLVIETVDIEPAIDAGLSTEDDIQAVQRAAEISGVVPGDVPADLPLFVPSSVTDFGGPSSGRSFVQLDTGESPAALRRWLGERLPAAGWTIGALGDDLVQAHKGDRRVEYRLIDLSPGTRIRLEYPASP